MNIIGNVAQLPIFKALRSRPFALLWVGLTVSTVGDSVYNIALAWQVLVLTGSGTAMGLVLAATSIPQILFLLIGGVAADRFSRRLVLLWSDIGRAVTILSIALMGWFHLLQMWGLISMGLIFGFVSGFCVPAYYAIPPQLVEKEDLSSANALNDLGGRFAFLAGPLLGAVIIAWVGPATAFAFDGLTFVFSALCLSFLRVPARSDTEPLDSQEPQELEPPANPQETWSSDTNLYSNQQFSKKEIRLRGRVARVRLVPLIDKMPTQPLVMPEPQESEPPANPQGIWNSVKGVYADIRQGLVYVVSSTWLWVSILIASFANIGILGSLDVALPKLVYGVYAVGVWLLGELGVAGTLGSIAGVLLVGQLRQLRRRGILAYLAIVIIGIGLALFGVPLPLPRLGVIIVANVASVLVGFGLGVFGVLWSTLIQDFVPDDKLGRVNSIGSFGSLSLTPVAYGIAGLLTDTVGANQYFLYSGILLMTVALMGLGVRDIRQLQ